MMRKVMPQINRKRGENDDTLMLQVNKEQHLKFGGEARPYQVVVVRGTASLYHDIPFVYPCAVLVSILFQVEISNKRYYRISLSRGPKGKKHYYPIGSVVLNYFVLTVVRCKISEWGHMVKYSLLWIISACASLSRFYLSIFSGSV